MDAIVYCPDCPFGVESLISHLSGVLAANRSQLSTSLGIVLSGRVLPRPWECPLPEMQFASVTTSQWSKGLAVLPQSEDNSQSHPSSRASCGFSWCFSMSLILGSTSPQTYLNLLPSLLYRVFLSVLPIYFLHVSFCVKAEFRGKLN